MIQIDRVLKIPLVYNNLKPIDKRVLQYFAGLSENNIPL